MKGEESPVAAEKVVKGEPKTLVKNYFQDPSGQFFAGTWSSGVGKWKVEYSEHEFCHLLEGRVTLTSEEYDQWLKVAQKSSYAEFSKEVPNGDKLIKEALSVK